MGIVESLKKGYFFIEDKYYALLDRINRVVPVYKVIDPIDRVVPSFVLFLGLLCLLIFFLFIFPLLPNIFPTPPPEGVALVKVFDSNTNDPLEGAKVKFTFIDSNESISADTNSDGIALLEIGKEKAIGSLEITAEGYERYFKSEMDLSPEEIKALPLKRTEAVFKGERISIWVYDDETKKKITDRLITINFSCRGTGEMETQQDFQRSSIPFKAEKPGEGCEEVWVTVSARDYESLTKMVTSGTVDFFLKPKEEPEKPTTGSLKVTVLDHLGNPAEDIEVSVHDALNSNPLLTKFSKESGTVVFEKLDPGYYDVLANAGDGRTKKERNIQVTVGETASAELVLPKLVLAKKKLFFQIVDSQSGEPLKNAHANVRMNGTLLSSLDVNSDGTITIPVGEADKDKKFTATISAPKHVLKLVELPVLNQSDNSPFLIKLDPKVEEHNFKPLARFTANPYAGNAPLEVSFNASTSYDPDGAIVSYEWDFGDGNTSGLMKPTHTFTVEGAYTVTLKVTDDHGETDQLNVGIYVVEVGQNLPPVPLFSMNPDYGFAPLTVDFNAAESFDYDGSIESFEWDFGDGSTADGMVVTHTFDEAGAYDIELTVADNDATINSLIKTLNVSEQIVENIPPIARFIASPGGGNPPLEVSFNASDSYDPDGSIESFEWDFGDGSTADGENVTHTFTETGVYNVILTVTDGDGEIDTWQAEVSVVDSGENISPYAHFSKKPDYGFAPLTVDFNAAESFDVDGSIESIDWNFGDGSTAGGETVTHTFEETGKYIITLEVTDNDGDSSKARGTVNVLKEADNLAPIANFTVENNDFHGAAPFTVRFNAQSSYDPDGSIDSYSWNFGDGSTLEGGSKITVSHTFEQPGLFDVSLKVTDDEGKTATHTVQIQVVEGKENWSPVAIMDANRYHGFIPLTVKFNAHQSFDSDGSIVFYRWNFGDGSTEEGVIKKETVHSFESEGDYTVTLTVEDDDGAVSSDQITVQAYSERPDNLNPVAVFEASRYQGIKPLTVDFNAADSFDVDGSIESFEWDFGDGSTAGGETVTHTFSNIGKFNVKLTVTDNRGATASRDRNIEVIDPGVDLNPVAVIVPSTMFGQKPLEVDFSGSDSFDVDGSIESFEWSFGDGSTADGENVTHTFTEAGYFEVKLTVTDNADNTGQTSVFVQVVDWPVPLYGDILVKVVNQNNQPIEGALIQLYNEEFNTPIDYSSEQIYSGTDGTFLFEGLPATIHKYYSRAFFDPNLSGESEHKNLVPGDQINLKVSLSARTGKIEAFVHESGDPIVDVHVLFLKASDKSVLFECTTPLNGKCASGEIMAGTRVLVRAERDGYLTAESDEIEVIADNVHRPEIEMHKTITGVEADLARICRDSQCKEPVSSVTSYPEKENTYYLQFNLKFGNSVNKNARFSTIVGSLFKEALSEDYNIKITNLTHESASAVLLATCYNPDNIFETVSECTGGGDAFKQAVVVWDELSDTTGISKTVMVKVAVRPGLNEGDTLKVNFGARAEQDGELVEITDSMDIPINQPICLGDKKLLWERFIELNGERVSLPVNPRPENYTELKKSNDYNVFFSTLNCTDQDLSGIDINVLNENEPGCISFPEFGEDALVYTVATIGSLLPGEISEEIRMKLRADTTTDQTVVRLSVSGLSYEKHPKGNVSKMFFKVLSVKELRVKGLPNFVVEELPLDLSGEVMDENKETPINNAIVQIFLNEKLLIETKTDVNGKFSFKQENEPFPLKGDSIKIAIQAPGYAEFYKEIGVLGGRPKPLFACVTIQPLEPVEVEKGSSGTFDVISTECPGKVEVNLSSELELPTPTFTLDKTDAKTVTFIAPEEIYQGIYSIEVKGLLEGASSQRHIGFFDAIVKDSTSCFSIDKYVFDMKSGSAEAKITNHCFFENRDPEHPFIELDNAAVELIKKAEKDTLPEKVSFTWGIKSVVKQSDGSDFSITAIEKNAEINPKEGLLFELDSFNAGDYMNGSDEKGITGVKESTNYSESVLLDVRFVPYSNTGEVEVWIEGTKIKGRYAGKLESEGQYPIELVNKTLTNTEYAFITIEDLVSGGGE